MKAGVASEMRSPAAHLPKNRRHKRRVEKGGRSRLVETGEEWRMKDIKQEGNEVTSRVQCEKKAQKREGTGE